MKVLLENQLRFEDGVSVGEDDLKAVAAWSENRGKVEHEISFRPARVLMQDFTGVPAVVDLAAMRDALAKLGADPAKMRVPFQGNFANKDDWCTPAAVDELERALKAAGVQHEIYRYDAAHALSR